MTTPVLAKSPVVRVRNVTPLVPVYGIVSNRTTVMEGSGIVVSVTASNVGDGTTLYWSVEPSGGLTASDFVENTLTGSVSISNGQASFTLSLVEDGVDAGEGFTLKLRTGSVGGSIVATTSLIEVVDSEPDDPEPTYTLSANKTQVSEGESVIFTLSTTHVLNGTTFYWSIQTGSQTVAGDLSSVGGTVSITNGTGTFSVGALTDTLTEGTEEFIVGVKSSEGDTDYLVSSPTIRVLDVAPTAPVYTVSPVATSVVSGNSLVINVNTSNVPDGTILHYVIRDVPIGGGSDRWSHHNIAGAVPLTAETVALYNRLLALRGTKTLFLQHRAHEGGFINLDWTVSIGTGQTWTSPNEESSPIDSDCKRLYGKNPALSATDLRSVIKLTGGQYTTALTNQHRVNRRLLKAGMYLCPTLHTLAHPYTTFHFSLDTLLKLGSRALPNPLVGSEMYVEELLPGGKYNTYLTEQLDLVAEWLDTTDDEGNKIPVITRFLQEANSSQFWWGFGENNIYCSPDNYIQLFRYIYTYLRVDKSVDNILIQWNLLAKGNTYGVGEEGVYSAMSGYPGNDYVDIISSNSYLSNPSVSLGWHQTLGRVAFEQKKLSGLAEACCSVGGFYRPDRPSEVGSKATWHQWWANAMEMDYVRDNVFFGVWANSHRLDSYLTKDEPYYTNFKTYFFDNPRFLFQGDAW